MTEGRSRPVARGWLTWRRTANGWGYSPLDRIDRDNVHQLRMVWSRGLAPGRQEGTPLAYDGVLYVPQANDVIEAIDAVTGDLKWQHRRDLPDDIYEWGRTPPSTGTSPSTTASSSTPSDRRTQGNHG